ncbi:hypothetical protein [Micromonospora fulviviridis]|uniref:hypothetical protein n=1 Tax=Micromonospora fulviviridis TaxID=47860 RepID=UPI00166D4D86|nr:hypothetical protein [Micromonospora fulviviridis]
MVERFTASGEDALCDVGSLSGWRQRGLVSLVGMGLVGVVAANSPGVLEATQLH